MMVCVVAMVMIVLMVVLNLLLMVLLLMMMGWQVLIMTSLGLHVAPMIPLMVNIMVLYPWAWGSHGTRPGHTYYDPLGAILARAGNQDTMTGAGVLGGGVGRVRTMTHTSPIMVSMSVPRTNRWGWRKPSLRVARGHPHGYTSHLLSRLGQTNQGPVLL